MISIQLLFLFNTDPWCAAYVSTINFNTASVPIQRHIGSSYSYKMSFQYSFCSYSTSFGGLPRYRIFRISIQLLFLFNWHLNQNKTLPGKNFNTASVPIQQTCVEGTFEEHGFQYSFCSYSTLSRLQHLAPLF